VSEGEIITRRRKWSLAQKSALLDEVEAENGKVAVVARRHGISESLLYNWRSAWKAAACAVSASEPMDFVPLGIVGETSGQRRPLLAPPTPERPQPPQASEAAAGMIEIALPNGVRICVGGSVNERALSRVLRAMRSAL
jgi:transposase